MFSKKPAPASAVSAAAGSGRLANARVAALTAIQNPWISAGGAGLLFLLTLATLVAVTGDPRAGAPTVRISLAQAAASGAGVPGWREALAPEAAEAPLTTGVYNLSDGPIPLAEETPITGSAFITLPGGGASDAAAGSALPAAPIAGFTEPGPGGAPLPVIAAGGRTPAEAYARPFTANGKAHGLADPTGFVKVIADAKYGELLGAHLIGPDVSELLPELTLAQKWDLTVNELTRNVHTHPTLSEALQECFHGLAGHMINF